MGRLELFECLKMSRVYMRTASLTLSKDFNERKPLIYYLNTCNRKLMEFSPTEKNPNYYVQVFAYIHEFNTTRFNF